METVQAQELSLEQKLTMPLKCYCQMLSPTDRRKKISKFHFVCELLPFLKDSLFCDENTLFISWAKTFQMLKFIPMVFRIDKCGVMFNVIICTLLILVLGAVKWCLLVN